MRRLGVLLAVLVMAAPAPAPATPLARVPSDRELAALGEFSQTLIGVRANARAERLLAANGATIVAPELHIWRLPSGTAQRLVPRLRALGALRYAEPDRPVWNESHLTDPLAAPQFGWHHYKVGADRAEPPGPGVPITVIDTGLDTNHMEFRTRPNTFLLNEQHVADLSIDQYHGTIVSSTAAAPTDGLGAVGIYPQAALRVYDLDFLSESAIVRAISRTVAAGRSVINLSLGSVEPSRSIYEATVNAFGRGSLVVAASGNERLRDDPLIYPAGYPHVLTVGSTSSKDTPSEFSSTSPAVDLAAPGEQIPWQHPSEDYYGLINGTSFSSPIVAAATAWVWTTRPGLEKTQLFDLMRYSARDIAPAGVDNRTGFGVLDIPRALTRALPAVDPLEPNDDIDHVKAHGIFSAAARPVTAPGRRRATYRARLHAFEDPHDVYRIWVPARREVTATIRPNANADVAVWRPSARHVYERGTARRRDRIATSARPGGRPETVSVENWTRRGYFAYLDVYLGRGVRSASYSVSVRSRALPSRPSTRR